MSELTQDRKVHNAFVQKWKEHKDRTGTSQTKAAKALGIGQSALNQYLKGKHNGGIALNWNFIKNFSAYVGCSPEDLGWQEARTAVSEAFVPVRFADDGRKITDMTVMVETQYDKNMFAVLIESCENLPLAREGDILLCSTIEEWKSGVPVFVVDKDDKCVETFCGRLLESGDEWVVRCSHGLVTKTMSIGDDAQVYRVNSLYMQ